jgi:phytoene/squalene synthetase
MKQLYDKVSLKVSKLTTNSYSTSFSLGIKVFSPKFHSPIYSVYGFVRIADEIVDSFHDYDKESLLTEFRTDTWKAIERGISTNPILNSFANTVNQYQIPHELITTFLDSMEMDLDKTQYDSMGYANYILGSAEVIGLMCLKIFVEGDEDEYEKLKPNAMSLGSAFQKINFLRDMHSDYQVLGRIYFPGLEIEEFTAEKKRSIEEDIEKDFQHGYEGIKQLPRSVRFGVYMAYVYYHSLFNKIRRMPPSTILNRRVRIPNRVKYALLAKSAFKQFMF